MIKYFPKLSFFRTFWILSCTLLLCFCISGCKKDKEVDISTIQFDFEVYRLDKEMFETNFFELVHLNPVRDSIFSFYRQQILELSGDDDSTLFDFINNPSIQELGQDIEDKYSNFSVYSNELYNAFRYVKHYFPDMEIPMVFTFLSEFGYANVTYEDLLGIGLEMYLGADYKYYPALGFPNYVTRKFDEPYIVPNTMKAYASQQFGELKPGSQLIEMMVDKGKTLYFLSKILPDTDKKYLIGYSNEQLQWCEENEAEIWNFFINNDYLYEAKFMEVNKFVNDGPTTPGMPLESPGNIGSWLGWQIVNSYMERNAHITLNKLMRNSDHRLLFEQSKYKPKK